MQLYQRLKSVIRDVHDFPQKGIVFKDITPVLADPVLCKEVADECTKLVLDLKPDAVIGIESRGFFFGILLAERLEVPFIPIRKQGKLPYKTVSWDYALEYGQATVEMHVDAVKPGMRVLIHDDLLATGGTAAAAAELVKLQQGDVCGFTFLIGLDFLNGEKKLRSYAEKIVTLINYS